MKVRLAPTVLALFGCLTVPLAAHDGEWPPKADPLWDGTQVVNNPLATSHLYLDRIEFTIPNSPKPYADWISHHHALPPSGCSPLFPWGGWKTDFVVGDVDNDGLADDIVITMAGEAVFAAKMQIDFATMTGQLQPLWLWLTPYARTLPGPFHAPASCNALNRNNAFIWNFVADGAPDDTNEIAFVGLSAGNEEQLFILRTDPTHPDGVAVVAQTPPAFEVEHRLGVCRVRNTAFPRDIVMTEHHNGRVFIWSHEGTGLNLKYKGDPFVGTGIKAKVHECNWLDIDGDGFDEFFLNGLVDFVDADPNGDPVSTSGTGGIARWQIMDAPIPGGPGTGAHCDQVYAADWDPTRPGLEVLAVTETGTEGKWIEAQTGTVHSAPWDTLWDADCGTLLYEWLSAPAADGQAVYGANWTPAYEGIEAITSPKDYTGKELVIAPDQHEATGSYVTVVRGTPNPSFQLLTIDGALYHGPSPPLGYPYEPTNTLKVRSGGPWGRMYALDWNGDYASDEILHHPRDDGNLIVFRLGAKGDWGTGPLPPGLPEQPLVESLVPPIQGEGDDPSCGGPTGWWSFYSQGECGEHIPPAPNPWSWSQGGPGQGSHYFQKLKEVMPNTGQWGAIVTKPYDIGGLDHREEILAVSIQPTPMLHIYFNNAPLPTGAFARPSPHGSLAYRAYRQTDPIQPFQFQKDAVAIERFGIRPSNPVLPERVVGIPLAGSAQLEAFIEFSDGTETDVTSLVTWVQDSDSQPYLSISSSGLVTESGGVPLSGRFQAELTIEGKLQRSEPSYVYASNTNKPSILRAGFKESWIVSDPTQDDRPLRVEAWVAQRDNQPVAVYVMDLAGTIWSGPPLLDDGLDADEVAGDGIYSAEVTTQTGLALGDNLKAIRAMLPPIAIPPPPTPPIPSGVANSATWPYLTIGSELAPPWPGVASPPPVTTEPASYEAPRVRSLGYRGWGVANQLLLEAEVTPSPLHPDATLAVYANVPAFGILPMAHQGSGLYTLKLTTTGSPPGMYVIHVAAVANDSGQFVSDYAPKIRLHAFPTWDADDPAPSLGFCEEPVGW